jgi:hypothetical protein
LSTYLCQQDTKQSRLVNRSISLGQACSCGGIRRFGALQSSLYQRGSAKRLTINCCISADIAFAYAVTISFGMLKCFIDQRDTHKSPTAS